MLPMLPAAAGCQMSTRSTASQPVATTAPAQGLDAPAYVADIEAVVVPPAGWQAEAIKESSRHAHQVWLSPSGRTAYGVIHFSLPFPVGHDLALWGFMREMRRSEGEAALLEKRWDPNLRALRFVAQGGMYTVRTNLHLRGFSGWAVYAGTLTTDPVQSDELDLAEQAREHTLVGGRRTRAGDQPAN